MKANTNMNIKVGYKEKIIYINVYIHIPKYTNKAQIYGQRNCCTHFMKCPSRQGAGREGMGHGAWGTGAAAMAAEFVASVDLLTPGKNPNSERIPNPRPVIVFYIIALLSISTRKNQQQIAAAPPLSHRPCLCFIHFFRGLFMRRMSLTPPAASAALATQLNAFCHC